MAAREQTSGKALAECAAGVEVRREGDGGTGVDERTSRWHRPTEEECARGQENTGDVARREGRDPAFARRLEVIDRASAELDREWDCAGLRELVAVQAEREPGCAARSQIPPGLVRVEGPSLEEDVGRLGQLGGLREDVFDEEVDIRIAARLRELGRDGMGTEPGRNPTRAPDSPELCELRVPIEPVAGLRLERGRSGSEHPLRVPRERGGEPLLAGLAGRPNRREDAPAARVELLVGGAGRSQRELLDPVAGEARVRMAVDEPGNRREAPAVELDDVGAERPQVAHAPDRADPAVFAEHVCVVGHRDVPQRVTA